MATNKFTPTPALIDALVSMADNYVSAWLLANAPKHIIELHDAATRLRSAGAPVNHAAANDCMNALVSCKEAGVGLAR